MAGYPAATNKSSEMSTGAWSWTRAPLYFSFELGQELPPSYRLASTDRHVRVRHAPERDCGPTWCRRHAACLSAGRSACLSTDASVAALPSAGGNVGAAPAAATNTAAAMRAAAPSGTWVGFGRAGVKGLGLGLG